MTALANADTSGPPDDWCPTLPGHPRLVKPLPRSPGADAPASARLARPDPVAPVGSESLRRTSPILKPIGLLVAEKKDAPARSYARLDGRTFFQGERHRLLLQNTHPTRSSSEGETDGGWPRLSGRKFSQAYYVLAPGESEDPARAVFQGRRDALNSRGHGSSDEVGG